MANQKFDASLLMQNISAYVSLSEEGIQNLNSLIEYKKVKKNQYLLHEGTVSTNSYFVLNGCLRTYIIDNKGTEHVMLFSSDNWWAGDLHGFYNDKPSKLNIHAILDTEILFLTKEAKEKLFLLGVTFERYFRILAERSLIAFQDRTLEILSLNAEERYEKFCLKYPDLILKLPQKQIAAYVGVTPEFLSKVKSSSLRGKGE